MFVSFECSSSTITNTHKHNTKFRGVVEGSLHWSPSKSWEKSVAVGSR